MSAEERARAAVAQANLAAAAAVIRSAESVRRIRAAVKR